MLLKKIDKILEYVILPFLILVSLESISSMIHCEEVVKYNLWVNIIVGPVLLLTFIFMLIFKKIKPNIVLLISNCIYVVIGLLLLIFVYPISLSLAIKGEVVIVNIMVAFLGILLLGKSILFFLFNSKQKTSFKDEDNKIFLLSCIIIGALYFIIVLAEMTYQILEYGYQFKIENIYNVLELVVSFLFHCAPIILVLLIMLLKKINFYKTMISLCVFSIIYFIFMVLVGEFFNLLLQEFLYKPGAIFRAVLITYLFSAIYNINFLVISVRNKKQDCDRDLNS